MILGIFFVIFLFIVRIDRRLNLLETKIANSNLRATANNEDVQSDTETGNTRSVHPKTHNLKVNSNPLDASHTPSLNLNNCQEYIQVGTDPHNPTKLIYCNTYNSGKHLPYHSLKDSELDSKMSSISINTQSVDSFHPHMNSDSKMTSPKPPSAGPGESQTKNLNHSQQVLLKKNEKLGVSSPDISSQTSHIQLAKAEERTAKNEELLEKLTQDLEKLKKLLNVEQ